MDTIKFNKKNIKMIAHRGLSGLERENTMAAFIAAGNRSYYGIECDVRKTADGVFVIMHDANTNRVANVNKVISETNYKDLKKIELNRLIDESSANYLKIPTFIEYLDSCLKYRKQAIIEFKTVLTDDDIDKILEIIKSRNYLKEVTFISFHLDNLINFRKKDKTVKMHYLRDSYDEEVLKALNEYNLDLSINYHNLTKEIVNEVQNFNHKVGCWTVNDPINAERLTSWKVDYITSDILE